MQINEDLNFLTRNMCYNTTREALGVILGQKEDTTSNRVHKDCQSHSAEATAFEIKGSVFQTSGSANATSEQEDCQCHRALSRHFLNIKGYWGIISMNSGLIYQSNLN